MRGTDDDRDNFARQMPAWRARDRHSRYVAVLAARRVANQDKPEFFDRLLLGLPAETVGDRAGAAGARMGAGDGRRA